MSAYNLPKNNASLMQRSDYSELAPHCNSGYETGRTIFAPEMQPRNRPMTMNEVCPFNNDCETNDTYKYLNQRGVAPSPYFKAVPGKFLKTEYASEKPDSRLFDAGHGYTQQLDSLPIQVVYDLIHDNVSNNPALDSYGLGYKSYETTNGGQIQYYLDKEESVPFFAPVYAFESMSIGVEYKDPMDVRRNQYLKSYPQKNMGCLSWIDDSCKQRDDIISLQQNANNSRKFELAYR
jgi:hypothetical protein